MSNEEAQRPRLQKTPEKFLGISNAISEGQRGESASQVDSDCDVAEEAGLSEDSLYLYRLDADSPNRRNPSEESVEAIARALAKHEKRLVMAMERLGKINALA